MAKRQALLQKMINDPNLKCTFIYNIANSFFNLEEFHSCYKFCIVAERILFKSSSVINSKNRINYETSYKNQLENANNELTKGENENLLKEQKLQYNIQYLQTLSLHLTDVHIKSKNSHCEVNLQKAKNILLTYFPDNFEEIQKMDRLTSRIHKYNSKVRKVGSIGLSDQQNDKKRRNYHLRDNHIKTPNGSTHTYFGRNSFKNSPEYYGLGQSSQDNRYSAGRQLKFPVDKDGNKRSISSKIKYKKQKEDKEDKRLKKDQQFQIKSKSKKYCKGTIGSGSDLKCNQPQCHGTGFHNSSMHGNFRSRQFLYDNNNPGYNENSPQKPNNGHVSNQPYGGKLDENLQNHNNFMKVPGGNNNVTSQNFNNNHNNQREDYEYNNNQKRWLKKKTEKSWNVWIWQHLQ